MFLIIQISTFLYFYYCWLYACRLHCTLHNQHILYHVAIVGRTHGYFNAFHNSTHAGSATTSGISCTGQINSTWFWRGLATASVAWEWALHKQNAQLDQEWVICCAHCVHAYYVDDLLPIYVLDWIEKQISHWEDLELSSTKILDIWYRGVRKEMVDRYKILEHQISRFLMEGGEGVGGQFTSITKDPRRFLEHVGSRDIKHFCVCFWHPPLVKLV